MSSLHLRHWPGDPARPGLALHCMLGSAKVWDAVAAGLGGTLDLRGFDLPGHGRSPDWEPEAGVDYHSHVTRLAAAMIDRPLDLIGHSFGATVALRIAVGAPEAVRSLTLIEPVLFAAASGQARAEEDARNTAMAQALAEGRDADAARDFMGVWGLPGWVALPEAARTKMIGQIRLVADTNEALNRDTHDILRPGGLEGIDAPVMLISGSDSPPVIASIAEALAERLPDVGRAVVPGAAHMLPVTHPAQVAGLIAANLERA